jgi:hypothetical protein
MVSLVKNYLSEKNKEEQNNVQYMDIDSVPDIEEKAPQCIVIYHYNNLFFAIVHLLTFFSNVKWKNQQKAIGNRLLFPNYKNIW